jgi:hypothetical protein
MIWVGQIRRDGSSIRPKITQQRGLHRLTFGFVINGSTKPLYLRAALVFAAVFTERSFPLIFIILSSYSNGILSRVLQTSGSPGMKSRRSRGVFGFHRPACQIPRLRNDQDITVSEQGWGNFQVRRMRIGSIVWIIDVWTRHSLKILEIKTLSFVFKPGTLNCQNYVMSGL